MTRRILMTALAAILAVVGLAGCRTNVGVAARVDGHTISENDLSEYFTSTAKPVNEQLASGATVQTSPRSFVVEQLIDERLVLKVIDQLPGDAPTSAQINSKLTQDLAGKTERQVAESLGLKGYTDKFYRVVLRVREMLGLLQAADQADLQKVLKSLDFPVWVSPRYGTWDRSTFTLDGKPAIPPFVSVQPSPGAADQAPIGG